MAPNAQRPTAVRLDDLRSRLENVDNSSYSELLAFKQALEQLVLHGTATQTIAASKIRRNDVFEMFKLKNQRRTWWNETDYIIPQFDLAANLDVPGAESSWLDNALDLCSRVFRRQNEADVRTYINLIIMDVLRDVHGFQTTGEMTASAAPAPPGARPSTPPRQIARLSAFNEVNMSTTVYVNGTPIKIVGRFDIGFGLSESTDPNLDTYLAVLETKGTGASFESGFTQLLVYLAIVHCARARKAPVVPDLKVNSTVYGVLSDGLRYVFVCLDNNSMVSRSAQFDIRSQKETVMNYFRYCLKVVVVSSLTSSPLTVRVRREEDGEVEKYDYTGFEGLQDRIFTFQGVDAEQCDIVKWPAEGVQLGN